MVPLSRESFLSTNLKLCQSLNLIHDPSGTTVLMTWIIGNKIVVANAGDSRAALYKDSGPFHEGSFHEGSFLKRKWRSVCWVNATVNRKDSKAEQGSPS